MVEWQREKRGTYTDFIGEMASDRGFIVRNL